MGIACDAVQKGVNMSDKCDHANFDEYFGKCSDCDASRADVLSEQFLVELQGVYQKMGEVIGIGGLHKHKLNSQELELAKMVGEWLSDLYEIDPDELENMENVPEMPQFEGTRQQLNDLTIRKG